VRPEIVEYRDDWRARFEAIAAGLRDALGPLALRVDHIGSTSVPGLCAKDVIDVQVTVAELDAAAITTVMEQAGLRSRPAVVGDHRPPGGSEDPDDWRKLYFDTVERHVHVHVRQAGRPNQRYPLLFRDYLRAHPPAAEAYGQLKQRLAVLCENADVYADAKDPVCDIIMQAAEEWADRTGWRPD
jgi:GrpB-like predicted nucleotidyltransferase (UPF0157 family)